MTSQTFEILRLIADGAFHSGEDLAHRLGISRASIYNRLKGAEFSGLEIYRVRGRGYRLSVPIYWLDLEATRNELQEHASFFSLEVLDSAPSTNTLLLRKAELGAAHASVVAAEWQTQGRGRFHRIWNSGIGNALTFSLLWRFDQGIGTLSGLSLAVNLAVTRVLQAMGVTDIAVKWPNDVLWRFRKLAGILIELSGDMLGPSAAVIGIGLNVRYSEASKMPIDQPMVDLYEIGLIIDRNKLLAQLLIELRRVLQIFSQQGFASIKDEWQSFHIYQGKKVVMKLPNGNSDYGIVQGVDKHGALIMQLNGVNKHYHSGELSISLSPKRALSQSGS